MPTQRFRTSWVAREISAFSRFFDQVLLWPRLPSDDGQLGELIEARAKRKIEREEDLPNLSEEKDRCSLIVLNGTFNFHHDIQGLLLSIKGKLSRNTRLAVVAYNPYFRSLYGWANRLGLRKGELPTTYLTRTDLENIATISGYAVTKIRPVGFCPWWLLGIGPLINRLLPIFPIVRWFSFTNLIVLRPIIASKSLPSLTVVIPARNEKGNIENALLRMPDFGGAQLEVIYVEGNSKDDTWGEILRVQKEYASRFQIKAFQQKGKGKNDAVRVGFQNSTGDLLTILDADLTMPPELLPRFYDAYVQGKCDFVNGSRLVYPMEGEAMRFLNRLGNGFFAKALSFVLDSRLGDSLCGTKLVTRHDYKRFCEWRNWFGDFDPFGDFELLFPAASLGLGIVDIPVRYRARVYGETNIRRFRDGWILLRMTTIGLLRLKMGNG